MSPHDNPTACLYTAHPGWSKRKTVWSTNYKWLEIMTGGRRKMKGPIPYYLTAEVSMCSNVGYCEPAYLVNTQTSIPTCRWASAPPPAPSLCPFFLSNYKPAPGFLISHLHVSKWLFSVRPIRKLTHHAVTAANFFPLHVRWIACWS